MSNLHLLALAYTGRYSEALAALTAANPLDWTLEPDMSDKLASFFVVNADPDSNVRFALLLKSQGRIHELTQGNASALTRRLVDDGLPELAQSLLQDGMAAPQSTLLAADLAAAMGNAGEALDLLQRASAKDADSKRADLMLDDGQATELWNEMADSLTGNLRDRAAWAASEWEEIQEAGPKRELAQLMTSLPEISLADGPLSAAQALQDSSRNTRDVVAELLQIGPS